LRDAALVAMSYRLGLRAKELGSLGVGDVYIPPGRIVEHCELTGRMTKGGRPRIVYLTNSGVRMRRQSLLLKIMEMHKWHELLFKSSVKWRNWRKRRSA
jgi:integrase